MKRPYLLTNPIYKSITYFPPKSNCLSNMQGFSKVQSGSAEGAALCQGSGGVPRKTFFLSFCSPLQAARKKREEPGENPAPLLDGDWPLKSQSFLSDRTARAISRLVDQIDHRTQQEKWSQHALQADLQAFVRFYQTLQMLVSLCYNLTGTVTRDRSRWDEPDEQETTTHCLGVAGSGQRTRVYNRNTPGSGFLLRELPGWSDKP
jgi:hypothetical protein